jgi:ketosteroid isomerase-like protein
LGNNHRNFSTHWRSGQPKTDQIRSREPGTERRLKEVRLSTLDFEQAGDTGYEVGEATLAVSSGTAVVKFVVVWKKEDGQWRLHRDIWNTKGA